jgi:hypothetical protein
MSMNVFIAPELERFVVNAQTVEDYLFSAFEKIGLDAAHCGGKAWPHVTSKPAKFLTARQYVIVYDDAGEPGRRSTPRHGPARRRSSI